MPFQAIEKCTQWTTNTKNVPLKFNQFLKKHQCNSSIILAVICRSVLRVCGVYSFFLSEFYFECQVTTLTPKKETQEKRKLTL